MSITWSGNEEFADTTQLLPRHQNGLQTQTTSGTTATTATVGASIVDLERASESETTTTPHLLPQATQQQQTTLPHLPQAQRPHLHTLPHRQVSFQPPSLLFTQS